MIQQVRSNKLLPAATTEKLLLNDTPSLPSVVTGIVQICRYNKIVDAKTIEKTFNLLSNLDHAPLPDKLLMTLRPYAYGEDVIIDDIYGNAGEDVVIEWRGRYGEDVPKMGYMITEDMQTEMFALLGEGLWFDAEGIAKQVNNIELAQSDEINVDGVYHRLDYAAGTGKREVYFYDTATLTNDDIAVIAAWFKTEIVPPPAAKKLIPIRVDRTSKPPIGTPLRSDGHWSVQGLVAPYPFNEGSGSTAFCVGNSTYNANVLSPAEITVNGLLLQNRSVTPDRVKASSNLGNLADDITVVAKVALLDKVNGSNVCLLSKWNIGNSTYNSWLLGANYDVSETDNYPYFCVSAGAVTYKTVDSSHQWQVGIPEVFAGVRRGTTLELYRDGLLVAVNNSGPDGPLNENSTPVRIGDFNNILSYGTVGIYDFALIYLRALSPDENRYIAANPWQIYEPETVWVEI